MEFASIQREICVNAAPDVVFEVVSRPEHIRQWWNDTETQLSPEVGCVSEIAWGKGTADPHIEEATVVEADPPRPFASRRVCGWEIAVREAAYASGPDERLTFRRTSARAART